MKGMRMGVKGGSNIIEVERGGKGRGRISGNVREAEWHAEEEIRNETERVCHSDKNGIVAVQKEHASGEVSSEVQGETMDLEYTIDKVTGKRKEFEEIVANRGVTVEGRAKEGLASHKCRDG